jgi:hypothetical protein
MLSIDDDLRVRNLEATPALRRAIGESSKTYLQLGGPLDLSPVHISRLRAGEPFARKLRDRVIALGASLGLAPDQCVRRKRG